MFQEVGIMPVCIHLYTTDLGDSSTDAVQTIDGKMHHICLTFKVSPPTISTLLVTTLCDISAHPYLTTDFLFEFKWDLILYVVSLISYNLLLSIDILL